MNLWKDSIGLPCTRLHKLCFSSKIFFLLYESMKYDHAASEKNKCIKQIPLL